jgi:hypothetical protein
MIAPALPTRMTFPLIANFWMVSIAYSLNVHEGGCRPSKNSNAWLSGTRASSGMNSSILFEKTVILQNFAHQIPVEHCPRAGRITRTITIESSRRLTLRKSRANIIMPSLKRRRR